MVMRPATLNRPSVAGCRSHRRKGPGQRRQSHRTDRRSRQAGPGRPLRSRPNRPPSSPQAGREAEFLAPRAEGVPVRLGSDDEGWQGFGSCLARELPLEVWLSRSRSGQQQCLREWGAQVCELRRESVGVRHRPARHSALAPQVFWPDLVLDRSGSESRAQEHEPAHGHWWQWWPLGTWFDTRPPCHPGACQGWRGRTPPPLRTWLLEVRARMARRAASAEPRQHPGHGR